MPADDPAPGVSRGLDRAFRIGLVLKALDGLLELVGGLVLLFVSPASLQHFVRALVAHDTTQESNDFLARHLLHSVAQLNRGTTIFAAVYLLTHGLVKVVLVVQVLRERLWAYPWLIVFLTAFIVYQVYRLVLKVSIGLIALTVFDSAIVYLTWREYRGRRREHANSAAPAAPT